MILALELAGAFVAGVAVTLVTGVVAGKWYLRRKLGGMIDLLGVAPKKSPQHIEHLQARIAAERRDRKTP